MYYLSLSRSVTLQCTSLAVFWGRDPSLSRSITLQCTSGCILWPGRIVCPVQLRYNVRLALFWGRGAYFWKLGSFCRVRGAYFWNLGSFCRVWRASTCVQPNQENCHGDAYAHPTGTATFGIFQWYGILNVIFDIMANKNSIFCENLLLKVS